MKNGRTMENCLFCDLETPEEFIEFFASHRAHETGIIAHTLCDDIANLYRRIEALELLVDDVLHELAVESPLSDVHWTQLKERMERAVAAKGGNS